MSWFLIAWRFLKGVPWQVWAAAGLIAAVWFYGGFRYDQGVADQKTREQAAIAAAVAEALRKERKAAAEDSSTRRAGEDAIAARRKEHDDAKSEIPDQGLSARQRARACTELRRRGEACTLAPGTRADR